MILSWKSCETLTLAAMNHKKAIEVYLIERDQSQNKFII